jgi:hypothetical protein
VYARNAQHQGNTPLIDDDSLCSPCYKAPMEIGFTGSRNGLKPQRKDIITRLEIFTTGVSKAHHRDCPGSDADFHHLIREIDQANSIEKRSLSLITRPENLNQRGLVASLEDSKK